ncbi:MAG: hypothetical protein F4X99_07420 [Gammaproteobacteria bacterium]|nr:hypothetical protein [Gammaproteobacteria bacterium]MYE80520.1 hypothetical protein [Gammaproteobacteria bacterium]
MTEDEQRAMRDATRAETVARAVEDAIWRFNEEHEETISVYDLLGMVVEDLLAEGMCPACVADAVDDAFARVNADRDTHITEDSPSLVIRNDSGVYH